MIIGRGDISSAIIDRPDITFFCSGVSNSACVDYKEYNREIALIQEQTRFNHLVYFSSLCIYYSNTMYAKHKKYMEAYISFNFNSYTIVRLGNIDWGVNPHTLINYLKEHPEAEIQNVHRHIVTKKEFQYWITLIKPGNRDIMNIPGELTWVPTLVKLIKHNWI